MHLLNLSAEWKRLRSVQSASDPAAKSSEYISRLECIQIAVTKQLDHLCIQHPNKRVCLIYFNSSVTYVGDGSQKERTINDDRNHLMSSLKV